MKEKAYRLVRILLAKIQETGSYFVKSMPDAGYPQIDALRDQLRRDLSVYTLARSSWTNLVYWDSTS